MSIWVVYSEVNSEPQFHGYVVGNRKALDWVTYEIESYGGNWELDIENDKITAHNGDFVYRIAVKLLKVIV